MKKKVAIVGASGYSGEELVGLLLRHPDVDLAAVTSRRNAGQPLAQVFPKFASHPKSKALRFTEPNAELLAHPMFVRKRSFTETPTTKPGRDGRMLLDSSPNCTGVV